MANAGFIFMRGSGFKAPAPRAKPKTDMDVLIEKKNDSPIGREFLKRKATWSKDEGNRAGIEVLAQDFIKSAERNHTEPPTFEAAHAEAVKVAERVERKKDK